MYLERELSGKPSEAIVDARHRPFPVQLYPIDREELEREELIVESPKSAEEETSRTFMPMRKLEMLSEESGGMSLKAPGVGSKHAMRRNSALRRSAANAFSSQVSIVDLDDVQVRGMLVSMKYALYSVHVLQKYGKHTHLAFALGQWLRWDCIIKVKSKKWWNFKNIIPHRASALFSA